MGIAAIDVTKRFGSFTALDDVSVAIPEGSASLAVKKALQVGTQGVYLLTAGVVAGSALPEGSKLRVALFLLGILSSVVAAGMIAVLLSGRIAERLFRLLRRVPVVRVQQWMIAREVAFMDTDQHVRAVLQSHVRGLVVAFVWIGMAHPPRTSAAMAPRGSPRPC